MAKTNLCHLIQKRKSSKYHATHEVTFFHLHTAIFAIVTVGCHACGTQKKIHDRLWMEASTPCTHKAIREGHIKHVPIQQDDSSGHIIWPVWKKRCTAIWDLHPGNNLRSNSVTQSMSLWQCRFFRNLI